MKKILDSTKLIFLLAFMFCVISSSCLAAWWGIPGYEWALTNGLTSVKSQAQLERIVAHTDVYTTIVKFLELKGMPKNGPTVKVASDNEYLNNVVKGIFGMIEEDMQSGSLTPSQYKVVDSLISHARTTIKEQAKYLKRENLKDLDLYLSLTNYRAAKMIAHRDYREYVLKNLGTVKNSDVLDYGVVPFSGEITRSDFLVLMYRLLADSDATEDEVVKAFYGQFEEEGDRVLKGVMPGGADLQLDGKLTYSEMYTFLFRIDSFDFNPVVVEDEKDDEADTDTDDADDTADTENKDKK